MLENHTKISAPATPDADSHLFHAIVVEAPDAIIFADRLGAIRVWNGSAEALFGYCAAEVLGGSLDLIIPERFRRAHWEGFHQAIDAGRTKHGRRVLTTRSMHKDGSTLYVDLSFSLVRNADGTVAGAMAVARDCSERYRSERALRARLAELEKSGSADATGPDQVAHDG